MCLALFAAVTMELLALTRHGAINNAIPPPIRPPTNKGTTGELFFSLVFDSAISDLLSHFLIEQL
jgi:hypothetical protein